MPRIEINFKLHPDQRRIIKARKKRNTVRCGRKYGKSTLARWLVLEGVASVKSMAYVAPEYPYLYPWWRILSRKYSQIITRDSKQEKRVEFANGAGLDLWSMDNLDSIRPNEYDLVIVDECALSRYFQEAWEEAIEPTLARRNGDVWMFSTPKQLVGGQYFRKLCKKETDGWGSFHAPSHANPYLPMEAIDRARAELPDIIFRQEYLAEFVDVQGALVPRECIRYGEAPLSATYSVGVDLAISMSEGADFTAIVVVGRYDGRYYVVDVVRRKMGFNEAKQAIKSTVEKWRPENVSVEAVQYQSAMVEQLQSELTSTYITAVYPSKDKRTRFMPVLGMYEHGLITHSRSLPVEFEEDLLVFPEGKHKDTIDALVYAIGAFSSGVKVYDI